MAFIELDHVSHIYHAGTENEHQALSDVSLSIEEGEFVAILGTNGSGKSTLAKHLNALLLPTRGTCRIAGYDTCEEEDLWKIRQEVSMVFQNPDNQIIAAVVEDDVAFGPENLGMPPETIRENVHRALEAVHMTRFRKFAPHLLSGGQKQRVAIAGALAMQTHCLVLDEPTAMLDPQGREEVMTTVRQLHQERGMTIVHITHFMEEAVDADRIVVMDQGRLVAQGKPREIFAQADRMKDLGLDVPLAAELASQLRKKGVPLPQSILTDEELVAALTQ
ncbi:energy-coupling factor transporter ATPase [Mitsuokella sp.]|uniref:energy-coupling factor transporter ATPase n=1 Tax=Mitsuokella TaxID=52225 RepID=UPI002A81BC7D|nr:energy-coupling factor transporter ATPase [Mitsuokella sp.]MDY4475287.1 energy-coupling factor transporter ATPase [Mitsuokella sp.]